MSEEPDTPLADRTEIGYLLDRAIRPIAMQLHQRLAEVGYGDLRPSHRFVFTRMDEDGAAITDLATASGVTTQAISQVVRELVGLGYLTRTKDGSDRRVTVVRLTPAGHKAVAAIRKVQHEIETEWACIRGHPWLEGLRNDLIELNRLLRPPDAHGPPSRDGSRIA